MARGIEQKIDLTPKERVQVAFGYLYLGVDQHILASLFGVNPGRINETITAVRGVVNWPEAKSMQSLASGDEQSGASVTANGA